MQTAALPRAPARGRLDLALPANSKLGAEGLLYPGFWKLSSSSNDEVAAALVQGGKNARLVREPGVG